MHFCPQMILYSSKPSAVLFMKQLRQLHLLFSSNADTLCLLLRCFISVSVSSSDDDSLLLIPSHNNVTWSPLLTVYHMSSTSVDVLMDTLQADTIVTCIQAFHSMFKRYLLFIYSNRYTSSVNPVDSTCLPYYQIHSCVRLWCFQWR